MPHRLYHFTKYSIFLYGNNDHDAKVLQIRIICIYKRKIQAVFSLCGFPHLFTLITAFAMLINPKAQAQSFHKLRSHNIPKQMKNKNER